MQVKQMGALFEVIQNVYTSFSPSCNIKVTGDISKTRHCNIFKNCKPGPLDNSKMVSHNLVDSCLICRRTTLDILSVEPGKLPSSPALLQEFLNCFHINNILESQLKDLSTSCQFCSTCQQFLAEWGSIQTQMAQLTRRATQLKFTLSALLLSTPGTKNLDVNVTEITINGIQNSHEVDLTLLLHQTVDEIRNELQKEYSVNVVLDRIQIPRIPRIMPKVEHEFDPLAGHSDIDNDDEPMDDWRGDDNNSDVEYLPSKIFEMGIKTEEDASSDGSSERDPLDLEEVKVTRKSKPRQTEGRKRSRTKGKSVRKKQLKTHGVVTPDGDNRFKYNGHSLKLNDEDECYACDACDFKGTTNIHSVLIHIRDLHYTEEDKLKFTAVKTSDTEWLYGGKYRIVSVGEKFKCVLCGCEKSYLSFLIEHIRTQHVDMQEVPEEVAPLTETDTPSVIDSTPIEGVYQSIPYTFNPLDNKYTCGICHTEVYLRRNFGQHTRERHKGGKPKEQLASVLPDGPNRFKYHGHSLTLNLADQCYYCSACDYKGSTVMTSVLIHIRHAHFTEEDKRKFSSVKISDTEWLYGGEFKIVAVGPKFKCVSCGYMNSRLLRLTRHIQTRHADLGGPGNEGVPAPVTETASVKDATPIQGEFQGVSYTINPADDEYTCGICQCQVGSRVCFLSHVKERHTTEKQKPKYSKNSVIPDGPNAFKYNGHGLRLNDQDQCYYCSACDFKGNSYVNSILNHIRELHYSEKDKLKFTAVKTSDTEWLYGGKFKIIRAGEKYKCVSCGCVKLRLNELAGHIRNEHVGMEGDPPEAVPLPVTDTPSVSDSTPTQGVYNSVPYTFNPADNMYTCGMCQAQVSSRKSLSYHVQRHHAAPVQIICEVCGKEMSSKRGYQEHLRRHQADPKTCPTCNKKFYCPKAFSTHLKIHILGDAAKKHQCEYCGKRFVTTENYKNHVPIHTGEMPYECHVCGKKFRYSTDLSHHRINAHGVKPQTRKLMRINE